jgi:hydroxymethylglutaryl-CoA lyase
MLYKKIGSPMPFDVTLRDGLQALSKEEQKEFTTNLKLNMYFNITTTHNVKNIEIGSIVSKKVLPIFEDTVPFLKLIKEYNYNHFVLIPNKEKLNTVINNKTIPNFSFITSVSNSFQLKNTKKSLEDSDNEIVEMLYNLNKNMTRLSNPIVKLYVSCINECPIEGKIDNDFIVNRLLKLNQMKIDNICISDTCGSLDLEDFEYIIETCKYFGLPASNLSLHLHVIPGREKIVEKIIHKALDLNITTFDVSALESGGCSVTMEKNKLAPNLSYDLYYKSLCNYIIKKDELEI